MFYRRSAQRISYILAAGWLFGAAGFCCASEKVEKGFVSLFDGKTLAGWHLENGAKFVPEDGVLKHNEGRGWLRSEKEYGDFELRLEFRFLKPKQDGGVFLRSKKDGRDWPERKYEVQVENTARMASIFGSKFDLNVDLVKMVLKPDGEWNEYDIRAIGPRIEVRLNGELVSSTDDAGGLKRGYVGLQGEDGAHEYRNFRIKELNK